MCTAVNEIDLSALEVLESINLRLKDSGITLHLSEVKGPVMDVLAHTEFIKHLSGQVFLSHHLGVQNIVAANAEQKPSTTPSWDI
jgi:SulP family sulfate permease